MSEAHTWDAESVQGLRRRLGMTQRQLADQLGVRQQTVSEWETGMYRPRGASARLLRIVAEGVGRRYVSEPDTTLTSEFPRTIAASAEASEAKPKGYTRHRRPRPSRERPQG